MQKNKNSMLKKSGFSLVEVLISLFVLTAGITAISMLMTSTIKTSVLAKNQVIAAGLVQEGIELVRNLKQNNSAGFTTSAPAAGNSVDTYRIDKDMTMVDFFNTSGSNPNSKKLFINSGYYDHVATGGATKFYRKIKIQTTADNFEVTSLVGWGSSYQPFTADCNMANQCISTVSVMPK